MKPKVTKTKIEGCLLIEPYVFKDRRGEYVETWNEDAYEVLVKHNRFVQDDISISKRNVLRGLHGDTCTWKLVQCLYGKFHLVVLDCREMSESRLKWKRFILNDRNHHQILIPPGCLNGHLCITDRCVFSYKQTTYYNPKSQSSLRYDSLGINWGLDHSKLILSKRDNEAPYYATKEEYLSSGQMHAISYDMGGLIERTQ